MKVSIHVTGGVFGDDVLTAVDGDELTMRRGDGQQLVSRQLPAQSAAEVSRLARQVAELDVVSRGEPAVDGGTTRIEIDDDAMHRTIVVAAGDDPPRAVWDLLDAVEALQGPSGPSRPPAGGAPS